MIERFFRDQEQLIMAIGNYIDRHDDNEALPMFLVVDAGILVRLK